MIQTAFGRLGPHQRLWPMSGQTFRTRFRSVLTALKLPTTTEGSLKPLDPGSLRAGGASFLLLSTEDSELVRRRGRWSNHRMMEIYVQELTALTYSKHLHPTTLKTVTEVARAFPAVLQKTKRLLAAKVPVSAWHVIFSTWKWPTERRGWRKWVDRTGWKNLAAMSSWRWPAASNLSTSSCATNKHNGWWKKAWRSWADIYKYRYKWYELIWYINLSMLGFAKPAMRRDIPCFASKSNRFAISHFEGLRSKSCRFALRYFEGFSAKVW